MNILTIRTDSGLAEVGLFNELVETDYKIWPAEKQLSAELLSEIDNLLAKNKLTTKDIEAVVVYKGPGSFTGLRIGITVANTFAYGLKIPIISATKDSWRLDAINKILKGENEKIVIPFYGGEANITKPKK